MKQEETPSALALVTKKVEPPLTKKELLRATAIAMHKAQQAKRSAVAELKDKALKSFDQLVTRIAKKQIKSAEVYVGRHHYNHQPIEVRFTVDVDRNIPEVAEALKAYTEIELPRCEGEDEIYIKLQLASRAPERIQDMLKDAKFLTKLAEAGEKMLEKPTERDKENAITV